MFNKLTSFLTLACVLSTILAAPFPQGTTTTSNENFQPFTGNLGGDVAPSVIRGDDGFTVQGKGTFTDLASALAASCDVLKAQCTNTANSVAGRASGLTLEQCDQQDAQCRAAIAGVSDPDASPPLIEDAAKNNNPK
ncbi:hypothetical protein NLJ89_g10179 [Agrocybe chaxingu]|uniref:Uncharacterized protein n=1 Tax=Agrocybe chaxingu TaxID=84603 RepID=A0A9W8MSD3_9AGAR|nr:hypothetical protein NLJ89_g10179 [Agrocybe chaxingu]